jgi:hypothetical protein
MTNQTIYETIKISSLKFIFRSISAASIGAKPGTLEPLPPAYRAYGPAGTGMKP